ncbi:hypothetical protein DRQ19_00695 [bacterium]|nr:MAG: hypothetical protein DRQ19_00695 [bacterium]
MRRTVLLIGFILLFAGVIFSQPPELPERVKKRVETFRIWKLTEFLDLTDEQAASFFPRYNALRKEQERLREEHLATEDSIRMLLDKKGNDDELKSLCNRLLENRQAVSELKINFFNECSEFLTTEQQAKLMIFEEQFRREVSGMIRDIRKERRKPFNKEGRR